MMWQTDSDNLTINAQGAPMDSDQFDRIAARLAAHRANRRTTLGKAAAGIAAASLGLSSARVAIAQDATPVADELPDTVHPGAASEPSEFLFVQSFAGGSIVPLGDEDGRFTLTLDGANQQTIYFSDRPERVFGLATTTAFLEGLGFTPDNPPNAALVVTTDTGEEDVLIIELLDPVWDEGSAMLRYTIQVLADYQESGLAFAAKQQMDYEVSEAFGPGGLFIDSCADGRVYCHLRNPDGSMGSPVGPSPMTPFCFEYSTSRCLPCSGASVICAAAYPSQCIDRSSAEPRSRCGARGITWP
jgi:hypothetical protein